LVSPDGHLQNPGTIKKRKYTKGAGVGKVRPRPSASKGEGGTGQRGGQERKHRRGTTVDGGGLGSADGALRKGPKKTNGGQRRRTTWVPCSPGGQRGKLQRVNQKPTETLGRFANKAGGSNNQIPWKGKSAS